MRFQIYFGVLFALFGVNADQSQHRRTSKPKSFEVKMSKYQQIVDNTQPDKFLGKDDHRRYLGT